FQGFFDGPAKPHVFEGRSLAPLLHGKDAPWRTHCISEYDYATRDARRAVAVDQRDARLVMVFDGRWKYVHVETMRPMLFDLEQDPEELYDLGDSPDHRDQIERLKALHFDWARQHHTRITRSAEVIEKMTDAREPEGIYIAYWDQDELEADGLRMPPHLPD
ncbi:MAG: phosphonate monoester hydrolase, partial [Pseudomonadota bacterium]